MTTKKLIADILYIVIVLAGIASYFFLLEVLFNLIPIFNYLFLDFISIFSIISYYWINVNKYLDKIKIDLNNWSK